jgi:hypothetical protein
MRFVILLYGDEAAESALPKEQLQEIVRQHQALGQRLTAEGRMVSGEGLLPSETATTIRAGVLTDGPYAETREQIGGFYVVDCADLDEALAIAKQVPTSPGLVIEVRPTMG